jgi:hypothetical protein
MRQRLCHIYSLFGTKSKTSLKEVNRLEFKWSKWSAFWNELASRELRTLEFASGKSWLKGFFLRNGRARRYSLDRCEVIA